MMILKNNKMFVLCREICKKKYKIVMSMCTYVKFPVDDSQTHPICPCIPGNNRHHTFLW
jgi:hypothetical protein